MATIDPTFWRGRRVLVTGHTGFKGSWLVMWLRALGAEVTGLALAPAGRTLYVDARVAQDCESRLVDIRDAVAVRGVVAEADADVVFHLAAQALVRPSYASPAETWATNVTGTIHLLEALRDAPRTQAVVVVTSDKCYENEGAPRAFVESDPLGGHDPYSSSKAAAELATASWRRAFFDARGVGVATARAGNVIGAGDWSIDRLIPDLARSASGEGPVRIRNPRARRPWQHVLEPLRGYLMLAERLAGSPARFGGAWNFGPVDGPALEVAAMAEAFIEEGMGGRGSVEDDDGPRVHEAHTLALSIAKAERELGWRPLLTIDEALALTFAGYRAALFGEADPREVLRRQIDDHMRLAATGEVALAP